MRLPLYTSPRQDIFNLNYILKLATDESNIRDERATAAELTICLLATGVCVFVVVCTCSTANDGPRCARVLFIFRLAAAGYMSFSASATSRVFIASSRAIRGKWERGAILAVDDRREFRGLHSK